MAILWRYLKSIAKPARTGHSQPMELKDSPAALAALPDDSKPKTGKIPYSNGKSLPEVNLEAIAEQNRSYKLTHKRRGKLRPDEVEAIAFLVTRRKLTEREACIQIEVEPDRWYNWKSRNKLAGRFEGICARIQGSTINHAIARIESAGERDWRADMARLELLDRARFGKDNANTVQAVSAGVVAGLALIKTCYDKSSQDKLEASPDLRVKAREVVIECAALDTPSQAPAQPSPDWHQWTG